MFRNTVFVALGVASVAVAGDPPGVAVSRVPDRGIQPCVVATGGAVHLLYFKGDPAGGDLYYTRREGDADRFTPPIRVNSSPGAAVALGAVRGGQLAIGRSGRAHVAWNGSRKWRPPAGTAPTGASGDPMLYTRLDDSGRAFAPERSLMTRIIHLDGGGTVAADERGRVAVVCHANGNSGGGAEADRRVWAAVSEDDGATFAMERPIDADRRGACACCGLSAFIDPGGRLRVLYRVAVGGTHRDQTLLTWALGEGASGTGVPIDAWEVDACPVTTCALAGAPVAGGTAPASAAPILAWETRGRVYYAALGPGGESLKAVPPPPAPAPDGTAQAIPRRHPRIAVNARGETILAWSETSGWGRDGSIAWQVFDAGGAPIEGAAGRTEGLAPWSYAAVAARPDGSFELWY